MQQDSPDQQAIQHIGELLIHESMITPQMLTIALEHQHQNYKPIGQIFIELGYISEEELNLVLSQ